MIINHELCLPYMFYYYLIQQKVPRWFTSKYLFISRCFITTRFCVFNTTHKHFLVITNLNNVCYLLLTYIVGVVKDNIPGMLLRANFCCTLMMRSFHVNIYTVYAMCYIQNICILHNVKYKITKDLLKSTSVDTYAD